MRIQNVLWWDAITQGVNTVAGPFHPFGGAVDIIVVQQEDGTFKSSPWYVKFGKFQGILQREKVVDVKVNDEATDFHMYLDHKGEAFFEKEVQLDDHTLLSLPSAPLSGDEMAEFGGTKFLTFTKDSTAKGLEMQEVSNRDSVTNAVCISNECNNPKSGMPDDGNIEHVDTASTVCVSDALVNQPNNEVVIAPSRTNSDMVEGQHGTTDSNKKMLKKEESRSERSGKRLAKRSESIFGRVFGRKSEQVSPSSSAHGGRQIAAKELKSTPSMERAEIVADLLDRKWAVGCKEILLTPTKRWQTTAASTGVGTESSPLVETGSLMHGSEGSAVVVNEASSGQSGSGEFSRPENVSEGSKQSIMEESKLAETGISMHGSEGSAVVMNEASSGQSGWGEFLRPETLAGVLEPPAMENLAIDNSRVNMMRVESFTSSEYAGEKVSEKDRCLNSTLEEPTSILVSHKRSGDVSSSDDNLYKAIYEGGVQNGRCNGSHTTDEEVAPLGMSDEGVDRSTECVSGTEVVLMSGDGHIITAPVNFDIYQLHSSEYGQHVESSKEFPHDAFCNHDVQVVGSSSDDSEDLESDCRKQPAVVSCSSAFGMLEVGVDSGLNQLSGKSEGPFRIEEVPAGPLDDEVHAGRASEFTSENMKISSLEMTPDVVSEVEFEVFEDNQGNSFQIPQLKSEHSVVTGLTAVDRSWEEGDANVPDDPVVPKFITGQDGMDLQSEPGMNTDHLGTASSCMLDDGIRDSRNLATFGSMETGTVASSIGDKWAPMHIEAHSMILADVDLSRPIELESPGQQRLEHSSSNGVHNVDLKNEESEADVLKNCIYLEELANFNGDNNAVAFPGVGHNKDYGGGDNATAVSEVDDPVFEERHEGNNLSSSKAVDSDLSKQPFINMDARPGTRTRYRSKPVAVPRCAVKKKVELTSSASVPSRWYEAEREVHVYSRSVGSSPLFNTHQLHMKADATNSFKKDMDESIRVVDLVDTQVIEAIIYGSGKDSAVIVNAADDGKSSHIDVDLSVCRHLLSDGMGAEAAARAFASQKVSYEEFQRSGSAIFADEKLVVKISERYFSWVEAAPYIVDIGASGSEAVYKMEGGIAVETNGSQTVALLPSPTKWKLWPFSVRRSRGEMVPRFASTVPTQALLTATNLAMNSPLTQELLQKNGYYKRSPKFKVRTFVPTSGQLASLKLKEGSNKVTFTPVLGRTQVDARIYLWKWNTRIVVSDVDGTITKSDVLGQVMPLVGRDWTQSGVTRLFSAIKDNGYEFLFLSARAISQAYLTRQFLLNLKQDGEALPDGPVFISPDGLIPSLYREVIRRAPHEFKISCLERIRELFPSDVNPFYAGFGNRDTDEISYLKVGIPKGKIFLINPKGEVLVNHLVDAKSYSSLHTLVDDMFPPMSSGGQEDFNSWNFWKLPLPDIDDESSVNSARSTRRGGGSKR